MLKALETIAFVIFCIGLVSMFSGVPDGWYIVAVGALMGMFHTLITESIRLRQNS